jgi:hypothetical protein
MVPHVSQCQCGHTIDDLSIHLLQCPCGNERTIAHDTLWDIVATITSKSGGWIQREVSHLFPCHTWKRWDIVIIRDGFWILVDVVITNLIHTDLVEHVTTTMHASRIVVQNKAWSYIEQTLRDDFIPLATKAHGCLHPPFDSFFDFLCTCQYSLPSANLLGPFNVYILLEVASVDSLPTCASHCDFSTDCHAYSQFFISSTHTT